MATHKKYLAIQVWFIHRKYMEDIIMKYGTSVSEVDRLHV